MKLMWFHLMPYTELPDDFRDKHPSVWVDIHSSLFDPRRAHLMYNDFMDELEFAAACGFDAVCVNEHHSNGYGLMPSPNLIASALARRTSETALCVMGNSLALYNPPTRVAEEFAMIDCISGGRLIAGFPVGTPMDTCFAYGQNPSQLRERYYEAHDLVLKAWTEPETFAWNGRCRSRIRRSGSRAAARSRPGSGARRWTTSTPISPILATRTAAPRCTASGRRWTGWARSVTRTAPAFCNRSGSLKPVNRRCASTKSRRNISTAAACVSIRAGRCPPAISPKPPSGPALSARSGVRRASPPDRRRARPPASRILSSAAM